MSVMSYVFYGAALLGLVLSYIKSKEKTILALKKSWKAFENILPDFLAVIFVIGIALAVLTPDQISSFLGKESGWYGVLIAASIGAVTLIPGFVAFPLASALLKNGAGFMQIAAFVTSLMMVGIITLPLEFKTFGKKAAILRNSLAFAFSLVFAVVVGVVLE